MWVPLGHQAPDPLGQPAHRVRQERDRQGLQDHRARDRQVQLEPGSPDQQVAWALPVLQGQAQQVAPGRLVQAALVRQVRLDQPGFRAYKDCRAFRVQQVEPELPVPRG